MRIGVHVGTVITGIVGSHRPRFGAFGADLLTAEALQSQAREGEVLASPAAQAAYLASSFRFGTRPLPPPPVAVAAPYSAQPAPYKSLVDAGVVMVASIGQQAAAVAAPASTTGAADDDADADAADPVSARSRRSSVDGGLPTAASDSAPGGLHAAAAATAVRGVVVTR